MFQIQVTLKQTSINSLDVLEAPANFCIYACLCVCGGGGSN